MHKLDVCVADTATGEVKALIEERLNAPTSRAVRFAGRQGRPSSSGRNARRCFHYDANTGR